VNDQIEALRAVIPQLGTSAKFATDLVARFDGCGNLSDKQWHWVGELTKRASQTQKAKVQVGDLSALLALFDKAKAHFKRPAIVLSVEGMDKFVRLSVAGPQAKAPGTINVATAEPFGDGKWFGRITRLGEFQPSREEAPQALVPALVRFACDPVLEAKRHAKATAQRINGKLVGLCCFCNQRLTDERSTDVGYGPICAGHYGLPWGSK
jgi:Family of unknown function (DUF6011)